MRRLGALFLGVVLGGGLVWFAFHYHVVHTDERVLFIPKRKVTAGDVYVDVRQWSAEEWQKHPDLIAALVKEGHADLVVQPTSRELIRRLFEKFGGAALDQDDVERK